MNATNNATNPYEYNTDSIPEHHWFYTATIVINSNTRRHIARTLSGGLYANLRDDIELKSSSHRRVPSCSGHDAQGSSDLDRPAS